MCEERDYLVLEDNAINTQKELDEEIEVYFKMYSRSFDKTNGELKYISSLQKKTNILLDYSFPRSFWRVVYLSFNFVLMFTIHPIGGNTSQKNKKPD